MRACRERGKRTVIAQKLQLRRSNICLTKRYARAGELVDSFDELLERVDRDESKLVGHIRLAAPTALTFAYLGQVFADILAEQGSITMDVVLQDDAVNPAERGFDLAISGRTASYEGVIEVSLCATQALLCAAPAYLAGNGTPGHPTDLTGHDSLVFRPSGSNSQINSSRGVVHIEVMPRLVADDNMTLLRAATAGLGNALLPTYIVRRPWTLENWSECLRIICQSRRGSRSTCRVASATSRASKH